VILNFIPAQEQISVVSAADVVAKREHADQAASEQPLIHKLSGHSHDEVVVSPAEKYGQN